MVIRSGQWSNILLFSYFPSLHHIHTQRRLFKMGKSLVLLVVVALVALSFAPQVAAFGAGNIPSYSHLEDRAFRHGDIEDIIEKRAFPAVC